MSDAGPSIMDTCIAMTIFRYEFEWRFVGVLCLSPVRQSVFHWICADKFAVLFLTGLTTMILFAFRAFHSTIVRDLYMTLCSFIQRCGDLIKYHCATANMDQRYPNSTATELATMDRVCIICREEMVAVPGNAPPDEAVGIAARAAVGVAGAAVSLIVLTPTLQNELSLWQIRRSVMDIPAQAPVQPAIVNPVAAVNPIAAQCYLDQFQHLGAPPVQMEFPGGHGMAQAPIYLTPLGPAPSSMLMPQNYDMV
ncbi:hypothetical protein BASA61_002901 [Batrachochytrium salamandrivorans]|nr:hypothetical protein BASA61_002901 [Batrachochytrium salamandrivorans]